MVHCFIILRGHRIEFPKTIVFLSLKIRFVLANSEDPDEMLHYAAFHRQSTPLGFPVYYLVVFCSLLFCFNFVLKS